MLLPFDDFKAAKNGIDAITRLAAARQYLDPREVVRRAYEEPIHDHLKTKPCKQFKK